MFNLWGLNIHLYGLLIGIGVWIGYEVSLLRRNKQIERETLEKILFWAVLGGVIGARLYHVIDYWNRYYSANISKIFFVWEGGLGIWGAIAGSILAVYIYCSLKKIKLLEVLDVFVIGAPIAQAIGRVGNFVNGELLGKNGEPLFAYEAALNLILFLFLWKLSKKTKKSGFLTGVYLIGYGAIRILLEGMRSDTIIWKIYGAPTAVIFGIIAVVIGIFLFRMDSLQARE